MRGWCLPPWRDSATLCLRERPLRVYLGELRRRVPPPSHRHTFRRITPPSVSRGKFVEFANQHLVYVAPRRILSGLNRSNQRSESVPAAIYSESVASCLWPTRKPPPATAAADPNSLGGCGTIDRGPGLLLIHSSISAGTAVIAPLNFAGRAVHREPQLTFPALDGSLATAYILSNLFPGIEKFCHAHFLHRHFGFCKPRRRSVTKHIVVADKPADNSSSGGTDIPEKLLEYAAWVSCISITFGQTHFLLVCGGTRPLFKPPNEMTAELPQRHVSPGRACCQ